MDNERINRVLHRLYAPKGDTSPTKDRSAAVVSLIHRERRCGELLRLLGRKSRTCDAALRSHRQRSGNRLRALEGEYYMQTGKSCPRGDTPSDSAGVLSLLRAAAGELGALAEEYAALGFARFASETAAAAETCRALLRRLF